MHIAHRYIAAIFLTASLSAPVALIASPGPQAVQVRVYDTEHKDYHNWVDHENAAWGRFLAENHRKEHEYAKAKEKEQHEYWNGRHSHPDKNFSSQKKRPPHQKPGQLFFRNSIFSAEPSAARISG